MRAFETEKTEVAEIDRSVYDIKDKVNAAFEVNSGLTAEIVEKISEEKHDPEWMREFRLKALETEIEELGAHIVELENEINDPEVLRDHLLLRDKCDELDDTRFHQQELYDEWEKLAEEQETFENEGE